MNKSIKYRSYVNSDEKDWVVFIHGIGGDSRTFRHQLKAFRPHFNILLPDLRGHGLSKKVYRKEGQDYSLKLIANDVFGVMDNLNINDAHFVGGSFGAILIRIMQEVQPQKFKSVVFSGAVLRIKPSIYTVFKTGKWLAPFVNNHFLYKLLAYFIMPRKNHAKSRQVFIDIAKTVDPIEYTLWLVMLEDVKHKLDRIFNEALKFPALLIMGSQDHAFIKDSIKYCSTFPETQLEILKNCGHLSNIERYNDFNQSAISFLLNGRI